jgi:hypothetical protein
MIQSMSFLLKQSVADLCEQFVTAAEYQRSYAVAAAKALIALVDVTGSEKAAREAVRKAGASDCTVRNAMQLVWAYDAVVRPGHADEKWFDNLLYAHAVAVRAAIAKVGIAKLCDAKLFARDAKTLVVEFELIAETGMTRPEREAKANAEVAARQKADADKAKAAATPKVEAPKVEAPKVEAPKVEAPPATPSAPPATPSAPPASPEAVAGLVAAKGGAKGAKTIVEQFDAILKGAESFVEAVVPDADDVTIETLRTRAASFLVKLDAAVKARDAKVKQVA